MIWSIAIWVIAAVLVCVLIYIMIRPWLKEQSWMTKFFVVVEPLETTLYKKSETILFARLKMLVGVLLTLLTSLGSIDLTPVLPFLPDKYRSIVLIIISLLPLSISLVGAIDEYLRNTTTKPLEIVALPENKPLPLDVVMAVNAAHDAKVMAVETIKAEGLK